MVFSRTAEGCLSTRTARKTRRFFPFFHGPSVGSAYSVYQKELLSRFLERTISAGVDAHGFGFMKICGDGRKIHDV